MRIVVTGSKGFLGKYLCAYLRTLSYDIVEIDYTDNNDILDKKVFDKLPKYDSIIHLAAKSYVPDSYKNPYDFYNVNVNGTLNVLESAKKNNASVVFISSYLYGKPEYLPVDENHKLSPHNPYASSKLMCENLCEAYSRDFDLAIKILRPFNIYGEGQNPDFLIPTIVKQLTGKEINLMVSNPKRDYIHVQDVVKFISLAIENKTLEFQCFNVGSGVSYSVDEIAKMCIEIARIEMPINYSNQSRKNEIDDCFADISKAKKELNWEPTIGLKEGLKKIINNGK